MAKIVLDTNIIVRAVATSVVIPLDPFPLHRPQLVLKQAYLTIGFITSRYLRWAAEVHIRHWESAVRPVEDSRSGC